MQNVKGLVSTYTESVFNEAAGSADGAPSVDAIKSWLIAEMSEILSINSWDLAVDKPLINYGLSSMTGMIFSGKIEDWLGIELDPSVAWEYPTIESLAGYLSQEVKTRAGK